MNRKERMETLEDFGIGTFPWHELMPDPHPGRDPHVYIVAIDNEYGVLQYVAIGEVYGKDRKDRVILSIRGAIATRMHTYISKGVFHTQRLLDVRPGRDGDLMRMLGKALPGMAGKGDTFAATPALLRLLGFAVDERL